jgi:hypothetical protein
VIAVVTACVCVVRYGVVVQMSEHPNAGLPDHFTFPQITPGFSCPVTEVSQALLHLFPAGAAFDLEVPLFGFSAVVREAQKGKLSGLAALCLRVAPSESPERDAVGLFLCQFQSELFEPFF